MKISNLSVVTLNFFFVAGGQLLGCTTSITHQKIGSTELDKPGFSYFLPQQKFIASVTYELMRCPNGQTSDKDFEIFQTATLLEETEADVNEHYLLTYGSLNAALKTSTFEARNYPNQTLRSVGATIEDKTAAVIKNITGTAISVAKMVMGVPSRGVIAPSEPCNRQTYQALQTVTEGQLIIMDPKASSDARKTAGEAITNAKQHLRIVLTKELKPIWGKGKRNESFKLKDKHLEKWFLSGFRKYFKEEEDLTNFEESISTEIAVVPKLKQPARPKCINGKGVVFREPLPVNVLVCAPNCEVSDKKISANLTTQVAQLGRKMVITLKNKWFDSNNVSLSFAPNGALESMIAGKESSLEKFSGALAETSTQVQNFLEAKREKEKTEEEARKKATLNAIKAETDLLNAKYEKIEAENKLRSIGGTPFQ